jgi:hemolysin D
MKLYKKLLDKLESPAQVTRDQLAFLPAALEVEETPPSPIGRAIIWSIAILFVIAVLWAGFGKLDIVAVATGKIIPSGRVKTIQPMEKSAIVAIHVSEGKLVTKGEPLVTLDSTSTEADEKRFGKELQTAQMEWLRAQAFQYILDKQDKTISSSEIIKTTATALSIKPLPEQALFQSALLQAQRDEYQSRHDALEGEKRSRAGEQRQAQAVQRKPERTLPLINERADSVKTLYDKKLASREQHLALEQERIGQEQDLIAETARVEELTAAIESIDQQIATTDSEYRRNNLMTLMEARQKASSLEQEWIKAKQRNKQQVLYAPITGTVQQLAIHTVGGVVTPAQELMLIVPEEAQLEVEAFIQNKDIGFVSEGQVAEVKIDTFNFTKYGTIDAKVITISSDAVNDEKLGLIYPAKILLESTKVQVGNKWVNLSPGMSVTVEVKTGKRRIIEYFMSPLLRYKQESIRER